MTDFIEVPGNTYKLIRVGALDTLSVRLNAKQYEVVGTIGTREFVLAIKDTDRAARLFISKLIKGDS
jgi:hypothetical protein